MRRGTTQQHVAFARALVGDAELALREITQAAVHELGAPAAGAVCQVLLLDESHRQSAGDGIERDADTRDAATDDEHVDDVARCQRLDVPTAPLSVER